MGQRRVSSRTGKLLNGNRAYKLYGHRPMQPDDCQEVLRMRHFCELYGISRWTVYRLIKIHILVTTRKGGVRFVNVRKGCEDVLELEIMKHRNLRQPHKENKGKPYNLGYDHLKDTGYSLDKLPPNTYEKVVNVIPGKVRD